MNVLSLLEIDEATDSCYLWRKEFFFASDRRKMRAISGKKLARLRLYFFEESFYTDVDIAFSLFCIRELHNMVFTEKFKVSLDCLRSETVPVIQHFSAAPSVLPLKKQERLSCTKLCGSELMFFKPKYFLFWLFLNNKRSYLNSSKILFAV